MVATVLLIKPERQFLVSPRNVARASGRRADQPEGAEGSKKYTPGLSLKTPVEVFATGVELALRPDVATLFATVVSVPSGDLTLTVIVVGSAADPPTVNVACGVQRSPMSLCSRAAIGLFFG